MNEARIAAESNRVTRAKPNDRFRAIVFFFALWAAIVATYALCVFGLGGPGAMKGTDPSYGIVPTFRFNTIYAALIAFMATALRIEHRVLPRDFAALRGLVAATEPEWEQWRARLFDTSRSNFAAWLAAGAAVGQVVNFLGWRLGALVPGVWPGHYLFMNGLATVLFAEMGVLGALSLRRSRVFLAMGRRARINLLAPDEHAPFARTGLRASAYWFLGSSIASLLTLDAGAWGIVVGVIAVTLALGFVSLLLPSRGVHERMRAAKEDELLRVRLEIDRARAAFRRERRPRRDRADARAARLGDACPTSERVAVRCAYTRSLRALPAGAARVMARRRTRRPRRRRSAPLAGRLETRPTRSLQANEASAQPASEPCERAARCSRAKSMH